MANWWEQQSAPVFDRDSYSYLEPEALDLLAQPAPGREINPEWQARMRGLQVLPDAQTVGRETVGGNIWEGEKVNVGGREGWLIPLGGAGAFTLNEDGLLGFNSNGASIYAGQPESIINRGGVPHAFVTQTPTGTPPKHQESSGGFLSGAWDFWNSDAMLIPKIALGVYGLTSGSGTPVNNDYGYSDLNLDANGQVIGDTTSNVGNLMSSTPVNNDYGYSGLNLDANGQVILAGAGAGLAGAAGAAGAGAAAAGAAGTGAAAGAAGAAAAGAAATSPWWSPAASIAGPVIGGLIGAAGAAKAANIQAGATDQATQTANAAANNAIAEQRRQYDLNRSDLTPYREAGTSALTSLRGLMDSGSLTRKFTLEDFWSDPVTKASYQSGIDLGTKAIGNMAGSRGNINSGATIKALNRFGTDYTGGQAAGSQARFVGDQNNVYNKWAGVAGIGQNATNTGVQAGQNTANNISNIGTANANTVGNLITGGANARGAAAITVANTLGTGINNVSNWWSGQETLDKYLNALSQRRTGV